MRTVWFWGWILLALSMTGCTQLSFRLALNEAPEGGFWSAWGPSADDVWIVGGQADDGVVLRGSADQFEELAVPEGTPLLNWVHGTSSSDVWVGGLYGTLLHWNGSEWSDYSVDIEEAFWGIYAVSPDEVYAVGGLSGWAGEERIAMRFDGTQWSDITLPAELDGLRALFKVHHDGQNVWIVGAEGAVIVGDGVSFEPVSSGITIDISTVHSRGDGEVVMVGGLSMGVVLTGTREGGIQQIANTPARLFGVHVMDGGDVVIAGVNGYIGHFHLDDKEVEPLPSPTDQVLHGVFGQSGETLYSVGGNLGGMTQDFVGVVLTAKAPK